MLLKKGICQIRSCHKLNFFFVHVIQIRENWKFQTINVMFTVKCKLYRTCIRLCVAHADKPSTQAFVG